MVTIDWKSVFTKELVEKFVLAINHCRRIEHNKMMYDIFTPSYVKLWHRINGEKPYLNFNYKPKL
jgi:hypothetical protein